ncbi:MAG TPA: hypothetical protein DIT64_06415 [Verrucomicrobiales bacterium]|nr:hypothetical protein [Verrucomicrobiales bacterium]
MNGNKVIQNAGRIGSFCARHFLALAVTVAAACVIWTITYFALLLWAVLAGGGIGGPLAYPAGLLFFIVAATAACLILLFPATALAEWFARRCGFPIVAQIPLSVAALALLCLVASAVGAQPTLQGVLVGFGVLFLTLLMPLGLYWWAAQSVPLLLSLIQRVCGWKMP